MPVLELTFTTSKQGSTLKLRERQGRNLRGRWQIVKFRAHDGRRAEATWQALRAACGTTLKNARLGNYPAADVPTFPVFMYGKR